MEAKKLRVKLLKTKGEVLQEPREAVTETKTLKQWEEDFKGTTLRVLGVPIGGPLMGRDEQGEAFHPGTDIWMVKGDYIPVTYLHGFGPDDPWEWQERPVVIGRAKLVEFDDERGWWFDVQLDEEEDLTQRILEAPEDELRASSGAVGHLVRGGKAGLIDVWPVGELAVFDTNEWRLPANDFAVVEKKALTPALSLEGRGGKGMLATENVEMAEAVVEAGEAQATAVQEAATVKINLDNDGTMEDFEMPEKTKEVPEEQVPEVDVTAIADAVAGKMGGMVEAAVEKQMKALYDEESKEKGGLMAPNLMKHAQIGDPDPVEDFYNWVRTGKGKIKKHDVFHEFTRRDGSTFKAALQEGTDAEGGYLVPADELGRIIGKRDEMALMSKVGAQLFTTDRDQFNIPIEDTAMTKFSIVAEEGAISGAEEEPTVSRAGGANGITLYKFNKLIKISDELLEDYNSGLENFLTDAIGRAWAITDNYYMQVGTGSSQPQGAFVGGTAGLTLDSASAIGAKELPELMGKLKMAYRPGSVWVMNRATEAYLLGLTSTSQFQLHEAPVTNLSQGMTPIMGYPVFATEDAAVIAASAKSLLFGNFWFYGWVRNRSLKVKRLVELYAGNGQVGILAQFRAGGSTLQAEAFQYATHPTG